MADQQKKKKRLGGRPRKFLGPSKRITVTLAEETLRLLQSVDWDRAKAITKVTNAVMQSNSESSQKVKLVEVEKGVSLIVVGPSSNLRDIPGLKLVEISPANFILVLATGMPIEQLELAITDMIESMPDMSDYEKKLLRDLRNCLAHLRRESRMRKSEIIFVESPATNIPKGVKLVSYGS